MEINKTPASGSLSLASQGVVGDPAPVDALLVGGSDGTDLQALNVDNTGKPNINNISGTVSLPTGASTEAKQDDIITGLGDINAEQVVQSNYQSSIQSSAATVAGAVSGAKMQVDVITSALPTGAATAAKQDTGNTSLSSIDAKLSGTIAVSGPLTDTQLRASAVPVSAASLPLPTGASTSANQTTANASLSSIDGKITAVNTGAVTISSALPAGTNVIGKVSIDQTTPGTTNLVAAGQNGTWTVQPGNTANTTAWLITQQGRTVADKVRKDYSGGSVTTAAYTQLTASLASACSEIEIFDSSGQTLVLATGAAASEVDQIYIFPGGNGRVPLKIAAGTRVSVKAVSATASAGELDINFYT